MKDSCHRKDSHADQLDRWARFVRDNPRSVWKPEHARFIDSQVMMANSFYERLERIPGGKEKMRKLRNIRASP